MIPQLPKVLRTMKLRSHGFTLVELLIVVAIIAILAAVATPNFLEAQARSKVARVKSDMRVAALALESYHVDNNAYPLMYRAMVSFQPTIFASLPFNLTSPIAYVSSAHILRDTFRPRTLPPLRIPTITNQEFRLHFSYLNTRQMDSLNIMDFTVNPFVPRGTFVGGWEMLSWGPDMQRGPYLPIGVNGTPVYIPYDPTNGTISLGDIKRTQFDTQGTHKGSL